MIDREVLLAKLKGREGGYTDGKTGASAKDRGGETNHGITVAVARAFGYTGAMRDMTWEQAKVIYWQRYWLDVRFDWAATVSEPLAERLFDIGVNMGQAVGVAYLQRALNVLNRQGALFPDIVMDGGYGRLTHAALQAFLTLRGAVGERVLLEMVKSQQSVRYIELAELRPDNEEFEYGWQRVRVLDAG